MVDIGTGAWTLLSQIAADALQVGVEDVEQRIGATALPVASSPLAQSCTALRCG